MLKSEVLARMGNNIWLLFVQYNIAQNQSFAQLGIGLKSKVLVLSTYISKSAIP